MHLGMPECHKLFLGHCDLDLWPSFQEWLCPEHICFIIWCRNPKFEVVIPLGMAEWCIPFWVTLTLTFTSGLISRFFMLYYSYLSSNVSYARPIPLGAFVTCLWHFLFLNQSREMSLIITSLRYQLYNYLVKGQQCTLKFSLSQPLIWDFGIVLSYSLICGCIDLEKWVVSSRYKTCSL